MIYLESIKVRNGEFCNLSLHIDRIERTIGKVFPFNFIIPEIYQNGIVKCRITYNEQSIIEIGYQHYTLPKIKTLRILEAPALDYSHKWADRCNINALMLQRDGCDDILITQNGYVTDTSFCNIVFESKEGLFTPKTALLQGTKRCQLLENGTIEQRPITTKNLFNYNNAYLINAMIDLSDKICIEIESIYP